MRNTNIFIIMLFFLAFSFSGMSQRNVQEKIGTPYVGLHYSANWPKGELGEKYGYLNAVGFIAGYKTKTNTIYSLESNFFFGNKVKTPGLLQNLYDEKDQILNTSGEPSIVLLANRSFNINVTIGQIFPVFGPNPNSGIMVQIGGGYVWDKLSIGTEKDEVPQLQGDYKKGYDRLNIGFNTAEFIGYNFMANQGIYNFYAGAYFQQRFTKYQRDRYWDRPNELVDKSLKIGFTFGVRAGWLIPIYKRQPKEFYFN